MSTAVETKTAPLPGVERFMKREGFELGAMRAEIGEMEPHLLRLENRAQNARRLIDPSNWGIRPFYTQMETNAIEVMNRVMVVVGAPENFEDNVLNNDEYFTVPVKVTNTTSLLLRDLHLHMNAGEPFSFSFGGRDRFHSELEPGAEWNVTYFLHADAVGTGNVCASLAAEVVPYACRGAACREITAEEK